MSRKSGKRAKNGRITKRPLQPRRSKRLAKPVPDYHYDALLSQTSIRILELLPGKEHDPIECRLYRTTLAEAPQYEALSYAWGDITDKKPIVCDGKRMVIPTSLCDFLRRLRMPSKSRRLWADAICINQRDLKEVGHQVGKMSSIYSGAKGVIIWLGLEDPFDFLDKDEQPLDLVQYLIEERKKNIYAEPSSIDTLMSGTGWNPDLIWRSFAKLLRSPWFTRLWVLQEAGLATTALAMFGRRECDFDELTLTAYRIYWDHYLLYKDYNIKNPLRVLSCFPRRKPEFFPPSVTTDDFLELLYNTVGKFTSDPRDFVYALLGHPTAQADGALIIEPDYQKTHHEIFRETALILLRRSQDLRVLSAVFHWTKRSEYDEEPSWVPSWKRRRYMFHVGIYKRWHGVFEADAGFPRDLEFVDTRDVLQLRGFKFDTIQDYTDRFGLFSDGNPDGHWPLASATALSSVTGLSTEEKLLDVTKALLGWIPGSYWNARGLRRAFAALRIHLLKGKAKQGGAGQEDLLPEGLEAAKAAAEGGDAIVISFLNDYKKFMSGKRIFVTESGLVGSGPAALCAGDICCVLFGGHVPFLLRPMESGYRLVGEIYVPRVMQGEAVVDWMLGEKYQEQMFEIF